MSALSKLRSLVRPHVGILAAASAAVLVAGIAAIVAAATNSSKSASGETALVAAATPPSSPADTVRCQDLPHLWSGAGDIGYNSQSGVVHFVWPDGAAADVSDTEPGCAEQPGLEGQLAGYRDGAVASERADCQGLRDLVDAGRAERRRTGQGTGGSVPVTDAAQAAAARKGGTPVDAAVAKRRAGSRVIDLDEADRVLEQCPP